MSRYDQLLAHKFAPIEHKYEIHDTILYALGVGSGSKDLNFIYERDLQTIPAMATVLSYPGNWYARPEVDLDDIHVVHASERIELMHDLPVKGHIIATPSIVAIHDRGEGRGALVISQRDIVDVATNILLARVTQRALCRRDGGLGGPQIPYPRSTALPQRPADRVVLVPTSSSAAAIYRLLGDDNPLHIDPAFAEKAGFPRPILHGLSSYGHICRTIMYGAPERSIRVMDCRFTAPLFPGNSLELEIWNTADGCAFRAHSGGRVVIDNGEIGFAAEEMRTNHNEGGAMR
jgi:acyl dehydratase